MGDDVDVGCEGCGCGCGTRIGVVVVEDDLFQYGEGDVCETFGLGVGGAAVAVVVREKSLGYDVGQLVRAEEVLGATHLHAMPDVLARDARIDRRRDRPKLVQRPPRKHEFGRIVGEHGDYGPVPDPHALKRFGQPPDLLAQLPVRPAPALEDESLGVRVVVGVVCHVQDVVEGVVFVAVELLVSLEVFCYVPASA